MLAAGPWDESSLRDIRDDSIDRQIGHYIDRDDMVSTVMSTFVSATVHCARCHDHKFDPITQEDYYSLQAVFAGVDKAERAYDTDPAVAPAACVTFGRARRPPESEPRTERPGSMPSSRRCRRSSSSSPRPAEFAPDAGHKPPGGPACRPRARARRHPFPREAGLAGHAELPRRSCQSRFTLDQPRDESARRACLARWITDPRNPLTWRSIVNRVWHHHFGRGLVATPNDFGRMGALPSHPELLDWLAATFRESGGSLKQLHRLIVTSAVYRQSTADEPVVRRPSTPTTSGSGGRIAGGSMPNRSTTRSSSVAGRLDTTMGGPSVQQFTLSPGVHVTPVVDYTQYDWDSPGSRRRARLPLRVPHPARPVLRCPRLGRPLAAHRRAQRVDHAAPGAGAAEQPVRPAPVRALRVAACAGILQDSTTRFASPLWLAYGRPPASEELSAARRVCRPARPVELLPRDHQQQ